MFSLYGAIPGAPMFRGMMPGMPQPMGAPGMAAPNMPMANASPPPYQAPSQRGGMGMPMAPPPQMQGQQGGQGGGMDMATMMMLARGKNGQQGVPGSQLGGIAGISGADVRRFLGLDATGDKGPMAGPDMMGEKMPGVPFAVPPIDGAMPPVPGEMGFIPPPIAPEVPWWLSLGFGGG